MALEASAKEQQQPPAQSHAASNMIDTNQKNAQ